MLIHEDLLRDHGAIFKTYKKGETIFSEGNVAFYYYQIVEGLVKMVNVGNEHDFIQGIFAGGESFGEPPMICEKKYPASAIALTGVRVLALPRKHFIVMLQKNFDLHWSITQCLCERIYHKANLLKVINLGDPEARILGIIDLLRDKLGDRNDDREGRFVVPITRQDLADLTGMRVETVIRKIGLLEEKGELSVRDRKILRAYHKSVVMDL